ncbi:hypothetical protein [Halobacteriovorax sp. HLS]|uniref:hypothetical protein n=1 Tax=Halobacteriovorax sp. HLS TaxID=2234000 RepID=UPI000FDCD74B|nr:hypothetical protein [Halobacteriovorax sp. HLS]
MKHLTTLLLILLANSSFAFTLTPQQESALLKNLDLACEKVWCTGNYKIEFNSFKCKDIPGTETKCALRANFKFSNVKEFNTEGSYLRLAGVQESYPGLCYFIVTKESELSTPRNEITKQFYKDVDTCVTNIEKFIEQ